MTNQPTDSGKGRYTPRHLKKTEKKRLPKPLRALLILVLVVAVLGAAAAGSYFVMYKLGQRSLLQYDNLQLTLPQDDKQVLTYDDGQTLTYQGKTYRLNTNLTTVLFMGIDKKSLAEDAVLGDGGQADAILLVGMDTVTGKTTLLHISREAYAQVDTYTGDGQFLETRLEQLCLSYAYGNGKDTSAENTVKSVSRLLYGMPIGAYLALDLDGVLAANEAVGGVTLKSISELKLPGNRMLHVGDEIELHGEDCDRYIRYRDTSVLDSNQERMLRQRQYVTEFAKVVTKKSRQNLTFPVDLYKQLTPYTASDLDLSDVTFLSTCYLRHGASFNLRTLKGETGKLNGSAVFYVDQEDLLQAVIEMFYLPVEES